jgi:hypothetical protein
LICESVATQQGGAEMSSATTDMTALAELLGTLADGH